MTTSTSNKNNENEAHVQFVKGVEFIGCQLTALFLCCQFDFTNVKWVNLGTFNFFFINAAEKVF